MNRLTSVLLALLLAALCPAAWGTARLELQAPVPGAVLRPFRLGASVYEAGHRGVDLAADAGQEVRAAAIGTVHFAGSVAGRPSVSVDHGNGLRTTYTPVVAVVAVGQRIDAGQVIGHLDSQAGHCPDRFCLHWGLTDGSTYYDPMLYLSEPEVRLLPHGTQPPAVPWLPPAGEAALGPGKLPVAGPITSSFGMRVHPITGQYKLHDGVDIAAACATPVQAPWEGTVVSAGYDGGYGYRVVVEHGGRRSGYAHLLGIEVQPGQSLAAGEVLGRVGDTGYSTGCHLHWMVWVAGALVDPMTLVG